MTLKVLKSQIMGVRFHESAPTFEAAVALQAQEMKRWRAQEIQVAADKKAGVKGDKLHMGYLRPSVHPLVANAVNESDVADYEIVDDGPTPVQVLADKKINLITQITSVEIAAIQAVMPLGKHRAWNLRENDIRNADTAVAKEISTGGIVSAVATAVGLSKPVDVAAAVVKARSADDTAFLADITARRQKVDAIQRAAAQMMSDVDDLTSVNIDAWKMPEFPK
jgi:hypothetical protein